MLGYDKAILHSNKTYWIGRISNNRFHDRLNFVSCTVRPYNHLYGSVFVGVILGRCAEI